MFRTLVRKDKAVDWLEGTRKRGLLGNDAKDSGLGHPVAHGAPGSGMSYKLLYMTATDIQTM